MSVYKGFSYYVLFESSVLMQQIYFRFLKLHYGILPGKIVRLMLGDLLSLEDKHRYYMIMYIKNVLIGHNDIGFLAYHWCFRRNIRNKLLEKICHITNYGANVHSSRGSSSFNNTRLHSF